MSNMVQATIVEDSIAPSGVRLTTALLTFATIVLQDVHTHRTVYRLDVQGNDRWIELDPNKSTNSNRAKPTKQVLMEVWRNPFCPTRFPIRAATMHSSRGYLTGWRATFARQLWLKSRYLMLAVALLLMWLPGVHKQIANRLLMPWMYTTMVMTAVDGYWQHFISLRHHYAAQDEVQEIAAAFHTVYDLSTPYPCVEGEWHLPFVTEEERSTLSLDVCIALSVARCARTSYATEHGVMMEVARIRPHVDDYELLATRLLPMQPEHAGPKEHQAEARSDPNHQSGTLIGWDQLRHNPASVRLLDVARECLRQHQERVA